LGHDWQHFIGNAIATVLTVVNFYLRYKYGDPAVLPEGLLLSLIVVGIFLFTGWKGWEMVYRYGGSTFGAEPSTPLDRR
jgi:uncharacterized membrane protein